MFVKGQNECVWKTIWVGSGKTASDQVIPKGLVLPKDRNGTGGSEDWVGLDKDFQALLRRE